MDPLRPIAKELRRPPRRPEPDNESLLTPLMLSRLPCPAMRDRLSRRPPMPASDKLSLLPEAPTMDPLRAGMTGPTAPVSMVPRRPIRPSPPSMDSSPGWMAPPAGRFFMPWYSSTAAIAAAAATDPTPVSSSPKPDTPRASHAAMAAASAWDTTLAASRADSSNRASECPGRPGAWARSLNPDAAFPTPTVARAAATAFLTSTPLRSTSKSNSSMRLAYQHLGWVNSGVPVYYTVVVVGG